MAQNSAKASSVQQVGLDNLTDVTISSPTTNQVLTYNGSGWVNSATQGDMLKSVYDADNDGVVDSAEKEVLQVRNASGSTIAKASVVYISGATGQLPTIALADADTELTSSKTIGLTLASISNNTNGTIITSGLFHDVDTSAYADGDSLWLSSTAGGMVATAPPSKPAHSVYIGRVAYAHPTNGKIVVAIQNGYEINELHDLNITSPANNDTIVYNSGSGMWVNSPAATVSSVGLSTGTTGTDVNVSGSPITNSGSITLNIPTASATNRGALSSSDWSTFNGKQNALTLTTTGTSGAATLVGSTLNIPQYNNIPLIPYLMGNETYRGMSFANNTTTVTVDGGVTTSTSASTTAQSVGTTNFATRAIRLRYSATVVSTGRYTGTRGSSLLWYITGGFKFVCDFNISDTAYGSGCRQFYGMAGSTTDLTYTDAVTVASLTNIIGVGSDAADSNLQVFYNDATGTATKIDLGGLFPANRTAGAAMTTIYSVILYNAPTSNNVSYRVTNKESGDYTEGTIATNMPANTQGLTFFASRCMGTPVTGTGQFDLYKLGVYSL